MGIKKKEVKGGGENCHLLEFATSQEAWEKINEYFLRKPSKVFDGNSNYNSGISILYCIFIKIRKAWVDPNFDFNRMFNYKEQKWTLLVNNYLDLNKLDLLRSKVRYFQSKYNQNYNLSYSFDNKHDNGKGCLLNAIFSRKMGDDIPTITMVLRSSEITKRLIFDFLLVQRMGEYIYGSDQSFMLQVYANQMYCNTETVLMYHSYKDVRPIIEKAKDKEWKEAALKTLDKFMQEPHSFSKYKLFLRAAKCINPDAFPNDKHTPLLAKNLSIFDGELDIEYPENCITLSQRRKYLKTLFNKKTKK